jgi:hypothetical protein
MGYQIFGDNETKKKPTGDQGGETPGESDKEVDWWEVTDNEVDRRLTRGFAEEFIEGLDYW